MQDDASYAHCKSSVQETGSTPLDLLFVRTVSGNRNDCPNSSAKLFKSPIYEASSTQNISTVPNNVHSSEPDQETNSIEITQILSLCPTPGVGLNYASVMSSDDESEYSPGALTNRVHKNCNGYVLVGTTRIPEATEMPQPTGILGETGMHGETGIPGVAGMTGVTGMSSGTSVVSYEFDADASFADFNLEELSLIIADKQTSNYVGVAPQVEPYDNQFTENNLYFTKAPPYVVLGDASASRSQNVNNNGYSTTLALSSTHES